MTKRIAVYARASTEKQTADNQLIELRSLCERLGYAQLARANGVRLGRPSKMNDGMKSAVKLQREKGLGIKQIVRELQIDVGTVYSVV